MRIKIAGTGRALPHTCRTTAEYEDALGLPCGQLSAAVGVAQRYVCEEESQIDLAVAAAEAALRDAGLAASDIDLVLAGCAVPYQPIPATAPLVMSRLGIADGMAQAFDVNSTCLSFLTAFGTAARMITCGEVQRALVFSSEVASRALPWQQDPEVAALFGDGAAAAVVTGSAEAGGTLKATLMRSYPSLYDACALAAGGTRFDFARDPERFARHALFQMEGKPLFRLAAQKFGGFVTDLLDRAGWTRDEVSLVVPHQASPAALAHMIRQTGFDPSIVMDITRDYGNQIAASIPFVLDMARREGRIHAGDKLLFLGTSAGVSFGGMALEY
ncbi:3-oxoacyl-ACP synthase III family protein [Phaeobacter sp. HF9A]|uniref:3-oxoacyl-ACP synthase III family protein n=1 Tax=Phaeobacter sp. HF9A TaxID=2721561 RepID=UPI00142F86A5|nr:3-oxoacyl-[acyl-carrier-protein] synthase III C-terminal domain-containing protein [Phaeobacter sp. HF9A]NIZ12522.1 ketoacyl-ACP synthase III [Phaeobacter sp. HF9A]